MNLQPRIDRISDALSIEYLAALAIELESFEVLLYAIETDIDDYMECVGKRENERRKLNE